jgi:N-glycosylase/DNA lyase
MRSPRRSGFSGAPLYELRQCGIGFRDRYVQSLAQGVVSGVLSLEGIASMDDKGAKAALMGVFGIGAKVADCILLFGYHRLDAFPMDVWMKRVVNERYGGAFPMERYRGFAGVLQQYLFYYVRSAGRGFG